MPAQKELEGLIGQFGIDTRGEQEILQERANKNWKEAMQGEYQERYPGDAGMQRAGAALGTALGNKFNNKLTETQQREKTAAEEARAAVQLQVDDGMFQDPEGKLDPVKRAKALEKEVAKSLVRQNDQRGIGMLIEIDKRTKAEEKDAKERIAMDLDIDAKRDAEEKRDYEWGRRVVNDMHTVWPNDTTNENDRAELWIDSEGNARNPKSMDIVFEAGQWSKDPPTSPDAIKSMLDGELTDFQKAALPSAKQRGMFKKRERDIMTQMELGIRITDALKEAVNPDGTLSIMGGGGKVSAGAVNVFDNIMAAGRGIGDAIIFTNDADEQTGTMNSSGGSARDWVKEHPGVFANIPLPEGLDRTDQIAVAKYNAILVQYAYGKARLNEENGRISDVDFEHAVTQIAAAATNPEALRQVLIGDVGGSVKEFNNWVDQIHPSVRPIVRTPKAKQNFEETHDRWGLAFKEPWGSNNQVGVGLLPEAVDESPSTDMSVTEFLNGGANMTDTALLDGIIGDEQEEEGVE